MSVYHNRGRELQLRDYLDHVGPMAVLVADVLTVNYVGRPIPLWRHHPLGRWF